MENLIGKEERSVYGVKVAVDTSDLERALDVATELKEMLEKCVELWNVEKWVPADQCTPRRAGVYWITVKHKDAGRIVRRAHFYMDWDDVDFDREEVLAWMPNDKPEAYKGEEDDEHSESC
mgnify:CR=1 FL=1